MTNPTWINDPKTEPEIFINEFMNHATGLSRSMPFVKEDCKVQECVRYHFMAGYCWHFANMLKTTFNRGEVCWTAPFSHFVWRDIDGVCYDIEGIFEEHIKGDVFYLIPEKYLGDYINAFKHISLESDMKCGINSMSQLLSCIKEYCKDMGIDYDARIEYYYKTCFRY